MFLVENSSLLCRYDERILDQKVLLLLLSFRLHAVKINCYMTKNEIGLKNTLK